MINNGKLRPEAGQTFEIEGKQYKAIVNDYCLTETYCQGCVLLNTDLCERVDCSGGIRVVEKHQKPVKVYISGPISGGNLKKREKAFDEAAVSLIVQGYKPVSPFANGLPADASYGDHMRADLKMMLDCDAIYMLRGWSSSRGAVIEKKVAAACGMTILYQEAKERRKDHGKDNKAEEQTKEG